MNFAIILNLKNCSSEYVFIQDADLDSTEIEIPRPDFWGGYRIWINEIELWLNQSERFHDRLSFKRELVKTSSGFNAENNWVVKRLQP